MESIPSILASRACSLYGFTTKSSAPHSMPLTTSLGSESWVKRMTGMSFNASRAFMDLQSSKPSISGMTMSASTSSGFSFSSTPRASRPLYASFEAYPARFKVSSICFA